MEKLIIRPVRRADLPDVLTMVHALARHHDDTPTATVDTLARDLFGRNRWARGIVARLGPDLTGYAVLAPLLRAQYGQRGMDLHHLFVKDHARGQGIGRALIDAACKVAQESGASYLSVGTHPDNHAAAQTYLACGFGPVPLAGQRFTIIIQPAKVG
jgi:GNAT superfamily N-acetyltransferase